MASASGCASAMVRDAGVSSEARGVVKRLDAVFAAVGA